MRVSVRTSGGTTTRIQHRNSAKFCYPDGCQCLGLFLVRSRDNHKLLCLPILHSLRKCNSRLCDPFRFLVVPAYNTGHLWAMHNRAGGDCLFLLPLRCMGWVDLIALMDKWGAMNVPFSHFFGKFLRFLLYRKGDLK